MQELKSSSTAAFILNQVLKTSQGCSVSVPPLNNRNIGKIP
jgi:hypothetical protein